MDSRSQKLLSNHAEKTARLSYLRRQRLEQTLNIFHQFGGSGYAKVYSVGLAHLADKQVKNAAEDLFHKANQQLSAVVQGFDSDKASFLEAIGDVSERLQRFEATVSSEFGRQADSFAKSIEEVKGSFPKDLKDGRLDKVLEEFKDIGTISNLTIMNYLTLRYEQAADDYRGLPYFSKYLPSQDTLTKIKISDKSPLYQIAGVITGVMTDWKNIQEAYGRIFEGLPPNVFDGGQLTAEKRKQALEVIASIVALSTEVEQKKLGSFSQTLEQYSDFHTKVGSMASLQGKETTISSIVALFEAILTNGSDFEADKFGRLMSQLD